jgi:DNA (cytosine-5)-methyltransferase 1
MAKQEATSSKTDQESSREITFIDLFSGCGGFSLGLEQAGLVCRAAVDSNDSAIETFAKNHPHVPHVLSRDLTQFKPKDLDAFLKQEKIDVVVGGPPCQGFSRARQADGANHGERLIDDPRRQGSRWSRPTRIPCLTSGVPAWSAGRCS